MKRVAVYGGSFDPITKGHEWVISEALTLFDKLYVTVCPNPNKKAMFTLHERSELIQKVCSCYGKKVEVVIRRGVYLVNFAEESKATHLVRGIRNASDLEVERLMRQVNTRINPKVRTLFLHTPKEFEEVSSSMVKSLMGILGWEEVIREYVSPDVADALVEKHLETRNDDDP